MTTARKKGGRPRNERSRLAVLTAAREILREEGHAALSVEGIARRAGAGKQTVYRWWPTKADVVMEALILEEAGATIPVPDSGALEDDLRRFLQQLFRSVNGRAGPLLRYLMVEAQADAEFAQRFRDLFLRHRRESLAHIFARARRRGEAGRHADERLLLDMIFGVMWYRLLAGHAPLDDALAAQLAAHAAKAWLG